MGSSAPLTKIYRTGGQASRHFPLTFDALKAKRCGSAGVPKYLGCFGPLLPRDLRGAMDFPGRCAGLSADTPEARIWVDAFPSVIGGRVWLSLKSAARGYEAKADGQAALILWGQPERKAELCLKLKALKAKKKDLTCKTKTARIDVRGIG